MCVCVRVYSCKLRKIRSIRKRGRSKNVESSKCLVSDVFVFVRASLQIIYLECRLTLCLDSPHLQILVISTFFLSFSIIVFLSIICQIRSQFPGYLSGSCTVTRSAQVSCPCAGCTCCLPRPQCMLATCQHVCHTLRHATVTPLHAPAPAGLRSPACVCRMRHYDRRQIKEIRRPLKLNALAADEEEKRKDKAVNR